MSGAGSWKSENEEVETVSLFGKKTAPRAGRAYPAEEYRPVIRSSICTGEKTACMQNRQTGKLTELMLIRGEADLAAFCEQYGVKREEIGTVY